MLQKYSKSIDEKWQKIWAESKLYSFDRNSTKQKIYLLEMFSYPSGSKLHLGHWWNYSLPDSWGRMKRMQGFNVFHPMGFDAFGLPAENYAIKTGIHPKDSTKRNIATMEEQLRQMGATFDWDYEIKTCEPDYYKWTQWLFTELYRHGLAYRKNAPVNWCPKCQTVLANEQAAGGVCERCGSVVEHKNLTQWFLKITAYADELLDGLKDIDWPEKTKRIQENWIGKSIGARVVFDVEGSDMQIPVFTTRVDTLLGVSYVVVAPESEMLAALITEEERASVEAYCAEALKQDEIARLSTVKEKTGVFTGSYAVHPLTGERVPVWVSDYVIASYGTGAVMAVPAHDERDFAFAQKFGLPVKEVITNKAKDTVLPYTEHGYLVNSGKFDGLFFDDAVQAIVKELAEKGKGEATVNYRLRDWSVSRQRYWGAPIPVVYCEDCGAVAVPVEQLPVELPYNVEFKPNGSSPLAACEEFIHTTCPKCGKPAKRETDTLDTFVCSSWYQLRYPFAQKADAPWDYEEIASFMPVDRYVGGVEHAAMHLLYARFIYKALRDMGYVKGNEPFKKLVHQGIILGADGQKMSKSLGNTVSADEYIEKYGSDVFRTYLAFGFSYVEGGPWSDEGVKAIDRFFGRITDSVNRFLELSEESAYAADEELEFARHRTVKAVTQDMEKFQFNTAVARLMELVTAVGTYQKGKRSKAYEKEVLVDLIKLIAPLAPHYGEEMWQAIGMDGSVFNAAWPVFDESKMVRSTVEIAVQVNSKIVTRIAVSAESSEDEAFALASQDERVAAALSGKTVVKRVYVKGRLLNVIAK